MADILLGILFRISELNIFSEIQNMFSEFESSFRISELNIAPMETSRMKPKITKKTFFFGEQRAQHASYGDKPHETQGE